MWFFFYFIFWLCIHLCIYTCVFLHYLYELEFFSSHWSVDRDRFCIMDQIRTYFFWLRRNLGFIAFLCYVISLDLFRCYWISIGRLKYNYLIRWFVYLVISDTFYFLDWINEDNLTRIGFDTNWCIWVCLCHVIVGSISLCCSYWSIDRELNVYR